MPVSPTAPCHGPGATVAGRRCRMAVCLLHACGGCGMILYACGLTPRHFRVPDMISLGRMVIRRSTRLLPPPPLSPWLWWRLCFWRGVFGCLCLLSVVVEVGSWRGWKQDGVAVNAPGCSTHACDFLLAVAVMASNSVFSNGWMEMARTLHSTKFVQVKCWLGRTRIFCAASADKI